MTSKRSPRRDCYVYAVMDGPAIIYIGKGTRYRVSASARRLGGVGTILHSGLSDDEAFAIERDLIRQWQPERNRCPGGNGGRTHPKAEPRAQRLVRLEMERAERIGTRVAAAQFPLTHDLRAMLPASKVDALKPLLMEVAGG